MTRKTKEKIPMFTQTILKKYRDRFMVFNTTFNNISFISWWSVLLVKYPEKTTDLSQVTDKLYHPAMNGVRTHNFSCDRQ